MTHEKTSRPKRARKLTVYLFNVGQGDNILLRLPNGEYGIIDCHYDAPNLNQTEPPALTYLKKVRRRLNPATPLVLSFICISHPDTDHVMGVSDLLNWIKNKENKARLKNLWLFPGEILEQLISGYREYVKTAAEGDNTIRASKVSKQLQAVFKFRNADNIEPLQDIRKLADDIGDGIKVVNLAPLGKHVKKFNKQAQRAFIRFVAEGKKHQSAQQNLISSILMFIYGHHRLLFGGDAGSDVWLDSLKKYGSNKHHKEFGPLSGNFVKASHHGSKYSSTLEMWSSILSPSAHIGISAGRNKKFRHPNRETLKQILTDRKVDADCPKILSTNTCHECVAEQRWLPVRNLDWLVSKRPTLKWQVEESFDINRPTGTEPTGRDNAGSAVPKYLTAYVYRFGPSNAVTVYKGLSSWVRSGEECLFKTKTSLPFPQCVLMDAKKPVGEKAPPLDA
jgi:beta-lactamase superfamily II metal-dependent hydrolase